MSISIPMPTPTSISIWLGGGVSLCRSVPHFCWLGGENKEIIPLENGIWLTSKCLQSEISLSCFVQQGNQSVSFHARSTGNPTSAWAIMELHSQAPPRSLGQHSSRAMAKIRGQRWMRRALKELEAEGTWSYRSRTHWTAQGTQ